VTLQSKGITFAKTKTKMSKTNNSSRPHHDAVMVAEVLEYLAPARGDRYLDLTAGYGGHAAAIAEAAGTLSQITLVDRDDASIAVLKDSFPSAEIIHDDFASASKKLASTGRAYDMILADLGVSSPHFDTPARGFSFSHEGPLDMRMDQRQQVTAAVLINESDEAELARIIAEYGEERRARQIAAAIAANRPLKSTAELADVIARSAPRRYKRAKVHPATKTFQAIRIAVNDELNQLQTALASWQTLLAPGGRLAIISFHSLEDRIVKRYLAENAGNNYDDQMIPLTKRPITASAHEIASNPRARSAKLRACRKK
jgi:16S rRNA (cytosine1402-N4)-methyltransferase